MNKHTPGPWEWGRDLGSFWVETEKDGYSIATVNNHNMKAENEANARLIAAAPELLEALSVLLRDIEADSGIALSPAIFQAHAAIAKATGAA